MQWELDKLSVETDVVGSIDGLGVVGEAKSVAEVTKKQVGRIMELASRLQFRRVIFATSQGAWSPGAQASMRSSGSSRGIEVEEMVNLLDVARGLVAN
jgi:hypothetical protein